MEQVEAICEYIVLINKGKNVLEGRVDTIKQDFKENLFRIEYDGDLPSNIEAADKANLDFEIISKGDGEMIVKFRSKVTGSKGSNDLLSFLVQNNVPVRSFNEILPTLNEIFIKQVGGQTNE